MSKWLHAILLVGLMLSLSFNAWAVQATQTYAPLGTWHDSRLGSLERWEAIRVSISEAPRAEGRRPVVLGVSGRNLELLQDSIARKRFRAIAQRYPGTKKGDLVAARRYLSLKSNVNTLRGDMAEAIFLDKNKEYGYVSKPNASQHDVYRANPTGGRGIHTGQVKFHMDGKPSTYARDMVKDHRSKDFFVPDDHVDSLRSYLRAEAKQLQASGDTEGAARRFRDANRVKPIGASSGQIDSATRQSIAEAKLIRVTPYVSLGVASILAIAPTAVAWYEGEFTTYNALYFEGKSVSIIGTGVLADQSLRLFRGGVLRGTLRGNALVAMVALAVDTSWSIYEYGGIDAAVSNPEFLMHFSGGMSATGLAIVGGYGGAVIGGSWGGTLGGLVGPEGVPIGAFVGATLGSIVVGSGCGIAGYLGGHEASRWVLKKFAPEYLFQQEAVMAEEVIAKLDSRILQLQQI